jgi:aspartate/methionine/tyrosine aminotransferase
VVPEEGIFVAMNAILEPGDNVICTFPGYQSLYQIAESIGCTVTKWMPQEEKGWEFDVDFLRHSITPQTKLIVVNFPHNPTGYIPSKEQYNEIINIAKEHGVYLFSDEMYRFLEYDPADRLPSAAEKYEKAISLFGMSNTFGMAGVRTGWVITRDANLYEKMAALKDYTTI